MADQLPILLYKEGVMKMLALLCLTISISLTAGCNWEPGQAASETKSAEPGAAVDNKTDVTHREMTRAEYTEELARQERDKAKAALEAIGDTLDDAWIHSKVAAKLVANALAAEQRIKVDVKDNVVTLRGIVDSEQEKAEAERSARETQGVKRVIDQLKIAPHR
jgi:osmotically-inducible protein OsmY